MVEDGMTRRGQGDRWLAGETIPGVRFEYSASVEIIDGTRAGKRGSVMVLMTLDADPLYLVALRSGEGDVRVRQSSLRRTA
jgi:hypothetical protein